jgi:DNA (cytosine-5)-methyltransferase 1
MPNSDFPTCIEIFSGAGGSALGLSNAGFDVRLAVDLDAVSVATYNENLRDVARVRDIVGTSGQSLLRMVAIRKGELDLLSGGPPCQGFSKQRREAYRLNDPRNGLVSDFIRLVKEISPRFFLLENVEIFGQKRGSKYLYELVTTLNKNYVLWPQFYNCADYGLAQTRKRFVLIGQRIDISDAFHVPPATTPEGKRLTIRDVIGHLPEPPEDFTEHPQYPNHQRARVTGLNVRRFSFVPPGGGWKDIPWKYRLRCHQTVDTKSGGWPDVYGRLMWDGQCPTITGGFDSFTRGRYGHPEFDRPITPHEAALLQGFPHWFKFHGTRAAIRAQIGNAVPPPLARAIGSEIRRLLKAPRTSKEAIALVCEPIPAYG